MTDTLVQISLDKIRLDGGTQWRKRLDDEHLERLSSAEKLPPLLVFFDGQDHWLVDGFHRYEVLTTAGRKRFDCIVREGTLEEAVWESFGTNAVHDTNGKPLSNAEKRAAVIAALKHPMGAGRSSRVIAAHVGVAHVTVQRIKDELEQCSNSQAERETVTGADGKTYKATKPKKPKAPEETRGNADPSPHWACPRCGTQYPAGLYPDNAKLCAACADTRQKPGRSEASSTSETSSQPAPAKWECPDCHTWWPEEVGICRECVSQHTETTDDRHEDMDEFNGEVVAMNVYEFVSKYVSIWPEPESLAPLSAVLVQLHRKVETLKAERKQ